MGTVSELIQKSDFGLFTANGFLDKYIGLEVDRVIHQEKHGVTVFLRVRNASRIPIKVYSFMPFQTLMPDARADKVLENGWLQCSHVGFKKINEKTVKNKSFLVRDQNPHSFKNEYGYLDNSIISEWFTLIKTYGDDVFVGAVTTANQFSQVFVKPAKEGIQIRVTCQYDGLTIAPGQVANSEKIYIGRGSEKEIEKEFSKILKIEMRVKNVRKPINGMCVSYYWNGNKISEAIVNNELAALEQMPQKLKLDYIQLDAGYTKNFGDWLDYHERFPKGFADIVNRINILGYKAGIWISPFSVSPGTVLHKNHKSWFLKDLDKQHLADGPHMEGRRTSPFDRLTNMTALEVLDPTLPEVEKYVKEVLKHFKNLGFELFKLDFLYPVCLAEKYSKPVTRAQALRIGLSYIKDAIGESAILTGIAPISPLVGIADFVRTGLDTLNPFVCHVPFLQNMINNYMVKSDDEENEDRLFLNGMVWRADPDVQVFRSTTGIDKKLITHHKNLAKQNKMSLWIGDSVADLNIAAREKLVKYFNKN